MPVSMMKHLLSTIIFMILHEIKLKKKIYITLSQEELDKDKQLALYSLGLKDLYENIKENSFNLAFFRF
jgi:hypothetical protein